MALDFMKVTNEKAQTLVDAALILATEIYPGTEASVAYRLGVASGILLNAAMALEEHGRVPLEHDKGWPR